MPISESARALRKSQRHQANAGLSEWRERALAGAATALKERERDDRDDEIALQNRLPRFNSWRGLQDLVKLGLVRVNIKSTDWREASAFAGQCLPL